MTGFIIAALIVGYFGLAIAWLWLSTEKDISPLLSFVVLGLWLALGLGFAIQSAIAALTFAVQDCNIDRMTP
jgi:hypothetical protein